MKRPMEAAEDSEFSALFGDDETERGSAVGGLAAEEHPYFKKRSFPEEPPGFA